MKILKAPIESAVLTFLSNDNCAPENLRSLKYLKILPLNDGQLLYNLITGELLLLSKQEFNDFFIHRMPGNITDHLVRGFFLVPVDFDDAGTVDYLRSFYQLHARKKNIYNTYTIYPTSACNARCWYCFEQGIRFETMTPETADAAVDFMIRHAGGNELFLRWFGGEPTLSMDIISRICRKLSACGISYHSHIVTNALLLTEPEIENAISLWHLKTAETTIDGTREIYQKTKAYVSFEGDPYETVLGNLESMLKHGINLDIRLNIGPHNADDLPDLMAELKNRFLKYKNFSILPRLLNEGGKPGSIYKDGNEKYILCQKELLDYAVKNHFQLTRRCDCLPCLRLHNCHADNPRHLAVAPDGGLYKCAENYRTTTSVGSVFSDEIDKAVFQASAETIRREQCKDCLYYPYCINLALCIARQNACTPDIFEYIDRKCARKIKEIIRESPDDHK